MIAFLSSDHFSHSKAAAVNTVRKARAKGAEAGPIPEEWDIEDHLTALNARISPLKAIGMDLLDAGIRAYRALWPGSEPLATIEELSKCLSGAETRVREWRSSAARAGADQALTFVLSWYEDIKLEAVRALRCKSIWTSDPELIDRRKEAASFMAGYADTRHFIPGPAYSDDEDDSSDDEEEDDDEEEALDEEIEAEGPDTATDAVAADTAKQPGSDIPPEAASDTAGISAATLTPEAAPTIEVSPAAETGSADPSSSTAAA